MVMIGDVNDDDDDNGIHLHLFGSYRMVGTVPSTLHITL